MAACMLGFELGDVGLEREERFPFKLRKTFGAAAEQ